MEDYWLVLFQGQEEALLTFNTIIKIMITKFLVVPVAVGQGVIALNWKSVD